MSTPTRIRLFIKPGCPWCVQAMAWLDQRRIPYQELDVIRDSAAWAEMLRLSGQTRAPVLEVDGRVLADFGVPELERFWNDLEQCRPQTNNPKAHPIKGR
jgi:glutaredoxin 3